MSAADAASPAGGTGGGRPVPTDVELARAVVGAVPDPELVPLTIADLGILRDVRAGADGAVEVTLTPTYSGCPALDTIRRDVEAALAAAGLLAHRVRFDLAPAWSSDDITPAGRRTLRGIGIAPPPRRADGAAGPPAGGPRADDPGAGPAAVACPRCGSTRTRLLSRFGATACRALWVCAACREPFEQVKAI